MGPAYGIWYKTKGAMGEEPPEHVKHAMALFDEFITTVDPDARSRSARS